MTTTKESTGSGTCRKLTIHPVTRVEGHGKVTIHLDARNNVTEARLHIVEFRGFERFILGRPYWEVPVIVQRLCGICPVSHHLAAAKAMDRIVGGEQLTPTAEKLPSIGVTSFRKGRYFSNGTYSPKTTRCILSYAGPGRALVPMMHAL
ncbi:MAG TPA: nickel-dependent hydrogenase large subunit, partial [Candidatus Paceibacterota bacterium]|nr:nickel-dependent hydrogenase large subunit [Candidatus Paceibacterota bacterium]